MMKSQFQNQRNQNQFLVELFQIYLGELINYQFKTINLSKFMDDLLYLRASWLLRSPKTLVYLNLMVQLLEFSYFY